MKTIILLKKYINKLLINKKKLSYIYNLFIFLNYIKNKLPKKNIKNIKKKKNKRNIYT